MTTQCPRCGDCALFKGKIQMSEDIRLRYTCNYCLGSSAPWEACKRFQMMEMAGFCPDFLMPNSLLSADQVKSRLTMVCCLSR
ncbi:MAG: hypothetical protein ACK4VN_05160 [Bacteroidales bacterium]